MNNYYLDSPLLCLKHSVSELITTCKQHHSDNPFILGKDLSRYGSAFLQPNALFGYRATTTVLSANTHFNFYGMWPALVVSMPLFMMYCVTKICPNMGKMVFHYGCDCHRSSTGTCMFMFKVHFVSVYMYCSGAIQVQIWLFLLQLWYLNVISLSCWWLQGVMHTGCDGCVM